MPLAARTRNSDSQGPGNLSDPKGALGAAGPAPDFQHQPPQGDAAEQGRDFCV